MQVCQSSRFAGSFTVLTQNYGLNIMHRVLTVHRHLRQFSYFDSIKDIFVFSKTTTPWELMDPRTKNDSDKTQGYV